VKKVDYPRDFSEPPSLLCHQLAADSANHKAFVVTNSKGLDRLTHLSLGSKM